MTENKTTTQKDFKAAFAQGLADLYADFNDIEKWLTEITEDMNIISPDITAHGL